MIVGIGVDICQISRFAAMVERREGVVRKLFSDKELYQDRIRRPINSLAGYFAAKEALVKAIRSAPYTWKDVQIIPDSDGAPKFVISDRMSSYIDQLGITTILLSISHDAGIAAAFVVCERES